MPKVCLRRAEFKVMEFITKDNKEFMEHKFFGESSLGKRHLDEFIMWINGATYKTISEKYGITQERVRQDIRRAARISRRHKELLERMDHDPSINFEELNGWYYVNGYQYYEAFRNFLFRVCKKYGKSESLATRMANCIYRIAKNDIEENPFETLKKIDSSDIVKIRNLGAKSAELLMLAKDELIKGDI